MEGRVGTASVGVEVVLFGSQDQDGDGYSGLAGDCDDDNASVNPGASELENGIDDDCNSLIDDGTILFDDDGDGVSELDGDCDDDDPARSPTFLEMCDGIDNDCDDDVDEPGADDCVNYWFDFDSDGYGDKLIAPKCLCAEGVDWKVGEGGDCDDADPRGNPGQVEFFGYPMASGSFDWNCDGLSENLLTDEYSCGVGGGECLGASSGGVDTIPDCAWWGDWGEGCGAEPGLCWPESVTFTLQTCR